ncbi:beta-L-arabinofuranosidase domain-containing protein [Paenibacillus sp. HB172176]|uniref:beta-L-arabinofuranosidase domain-containing protein n=1 Tax=Paenibacillus sp. HB172176 TaxID=2493690 RepID=UPI00143A9E70|nr:beta-L-arabinofuranosidase domain-containing protein [Paenibacillus sp. HB172176]
MQGNRQKPGAYFKMLQIGEVKPKGWMLEQMENDLREGMAGHLNELTACVNLKGYKEEQVNSFEVSPSGMIHDTPRTWWSGEQTAFWLDGFIRMAYLAGSREHIQRADQYMEQLLNSQDEEGYLGIYTKQSRFQHKKENGEFWTQSRIFMVMLAYYELNGKKDYLDAVIKALRLTMRHYGPERGSYFNNEEPAGGTGHGLMLVEALEWVYRMTGEEEFLTFALWCYQDYSSAARIRDIDNQLHYLLDIDKPFLWHTPHTTEHLRVPLWLYYETGDFLLKQASENAYAKIQRYLVPSGTCIGDENIDGREPDPSLLYEYCGMTELTVSMQSALQKTGDPQWGDRIERIAFNAAQGARLPDGKAISYLTRDNRFSASEVEGHNGKLQYSPTHENSALCCAGNAVKYMPSYVSRMWMRIGEGEQEGLAAVLYGPSSVRTTVQDVKFEITTTTSYPFDEHFVFDILPEKAVACPLYFRIPEWAVEKKIGVEGAEVTEKDGYLVVTKLWQAGDQVALFFQAKLTAQTAANGEWTLDRGALLYALPVSEQRTITRRYEGEAFVDFDALAEEKELEKRGYAFDDSCESFGFTHERMPDRPLGWHQPLSRLNGNLVDSSGERHAVSLVPIGNTLLRKVSFAKP